MGLREDKEHIRFKCRVTGLEGTFIDLKSVEADNPDVDGVKVRYIPFVPTNKSWVNAMKSMAVRENIIEETNTIYPRSAVKGPRMNEYAHKESGVADKEVVAYEDQYGNSPYADKYDLKMVDESIQELESRINSLRKDKGLQEVENLESEDEKRRQDDVRKRKPVDRRGVDPEFRELEEFDEGDEL